MLSENLEQRIIALENQFSDFKYEVEQKIDALEKYTWGVDLNTEEGMAFWNKWKVGGFEPKPISDSD